MPEMSLTNEVTDTLQTLSGSESKDTASEALMAHIDSVFSPKAEPEGDGGRAHRNEAQAQQDELVEEGLETVDGDAAEPTDGSGTGVTDEEVETEQVEPAGEVQAPLHPNLRYVAQYYGLTDDEIDEQYVANPALAERVFGKMLTAFTAQTSQQSRPQVAPGQVPQQPQTAPPVSELEKLFARQKEFAEANGQQLGEFLGHLKREVYDPFKAAQAELQQIKAQALIQQRNAIAAEATAVTQELAKQFPTVYGSTPEKLNLFQQQTRQVLYTTADQIRSGAYAQGKEVSVGDALKQAHLIVTADSRDRQVRDTVRTQVKRRSSQITARPTQRSRAERGGNNAEAAAIAAYEQRAAELGIKIGDY